MYALVAALRLVHGDYCVVMDTGRVVPWPRRSLLRDPPPVPSDRSARLARDEVPKK